MILDRSKAPEFKIPDDFELEAPEKIILSNNSPLFFVKTPGIDAVKIEVISKSNRVSLSIKHSLIPTFTLQMLQEGTSKRTGQEIAELFDFHASGLNTILSYSHEGLGLISTKKHLFEVFPLFLELFTEATFPQDALEKRKSQQKLSIKLNNEKTASKANQLFRKSLFGFEHPFGAEIGEQEVDEINAELLLDYYKNLLWNSVEFFVTGDLNPTELQTLILGFQNLPNRISTIESISNPVSSNLGEIESRGDAVQTSIRIGGWSIPKSHEDYIPLTVFNTILGGYFGSRLIKNIREDKGHTYGIHSSLAEIGDYNYWVISADVQKVFYQEVIDQIYLEIQNLVTVPLELDELEVVRNYMIGQMLSAFSSSFDLIDRYKSVHFSGLDFNYYRQKLEFLKNFTEVDILKIGEKYFSKHPFIEVAVG
ncbi:M16 family metallopeptidase [Algoriphagus marinus]|uniref:M16 family metallopeptidase n=1 Tax=Algoriphagus marinus TaxID=1925762 RepID=UPI00094B91AF|nr:insulinase family protein [Algoriphagus marinus]